MADLGAFLSKPEAWVDELGKLAAEQKKLDAREKKLKDKLKLHMEQSGLDAVAGVAFEFKCQRGERTDFSQEAIIETFGPDAVTKLPKKKTESFRLTEKKTEKLDPKSQEIVDHFSAKPEPAEPTAKPLPPKIAKLLSGK